MTEHFKAPEKIQLSDEEIANLSDAQFKTLVIKRLTELVEFGCKLDEKMKDLLSEIKENVQGTNSDGKETRTQINGTDQKEERNIFLIPVHTVDLSSSFLPITIGSLYIFLYFS